MEDPGSTDPKGPVEIHPCIVVLEKQSRCEDMNIEYLVNLYKRHYPGGAVWRLVQDINRQLTVYHNIVEELKKGYASLPVAWEADEGLSPVAKDLEARAGFIKTKYETLKLLPEGELPNPLFDWSIETAFNKIRSYSKGLVKIARSFAFELLAELNVEATAGTSVQITLSVPPALTIGFEKSLAVALGLGATAGTR